MSNLQSEFNFQMGHCCKHWRIFSDIL